jgi:hypothetical protein
MKRYGLLLAFGFLAAGGACGFGFYDNSGHPDPPTNYWGWQCADGTVPIPDAGCLPQTCDDASTPALDGGSCACADGSDVLPSSCSDGGS